MNRGDVEIVESTLVETSAYTPSNQASGGALFIRGGSIAISRSNLTDASAQTVSGMSHGGCLHVASGTLLLMSSRIEQARATSDSGMALGGGVYLGGGIVELTSSEVTHAAAMVTGSGMMHMAYGGGLYVKNGNLKTMNTTVAWCRAMRGGAVFVAESAQGDSVTLIRVTLSWNVAPIGAAISVASDYEVVSALLAIKHSCAAGTNSLSATVVDASGSPNPIMLPLGGLSVENTCTNASSAQMLANVALIQCTSPETSPCGSDATCATTALSPSLAATSYTCSCTGLAYAAPSSSDAEVAPYMDFEGCIVPLQVEELSHWAQRALVTLMKNATSAQTQQIELSLRLSGTAWTRSVYQWVVVEDSSRPSWLSMPQYTGNVTEPLSESAQPPRAASSSNKSSAVDVRTFRDAAS